MVRILQSDVISEFDVKYRNNRGELVDVTTPTVSVFDFANTLVFTTTTGFSQVAIPGHYRHQLNPSPILTQGTYRAIYYGTYSGQKLFADSDEMFEIRSLSDVYAYASVRELVSYTQIPEPVDTLLLRTLLQVATEAINNYCRRQFRRYTVLSEKHVLNMHDTIHLKQYPAVSISSITIEGDVVSSDEYRLDNNTGRIRFIGGVKSGDVIITYVAGVDVVPQEINLACLKIASYLYLRKRREGTSNESLLGYRYDLWNEKGIAPEIREVKNMLDNYALVSLY